MNDILDTDALRRPPWSNLDAIADLLDATADEVDRLRAENEHLAGKLSAATANRDHAVDGFQRLRAVIENAPHAYNCPFDARNIEPWSTCWKADAL